ncbi:alkaline phosphatase [Teredinibacter purpureus]|uniref:alkaline phosphatase n=1 Tax=Teredinibacter purpureus TaxID=2731756 RepID=UPI0005F7CAB3|nr:alkaline phosphatase [Teredinibacter purpureus]
MNNVKIALLSAVIVSLVACSGDDGRNGDNTLIDKTTLELGDSHCPAGGLQIDTGLDTNANGSLDSSELADTHYLCLPYDADDFDMLANTRGNRWYKAGAATTANASGYTTAVGAAKNVILFVGDGMGVSTVTAARILEGQLKGMLGEENVLSFGEFPFSGLAKTYNVDAQTPDSAGTMTAMMSGVKTDVGVIGVDENIVRGDCSTVAGNELVTALELAEIAGKSTGIISTARITHATPAATYAKSADRNWEDNSDMPTAAVDAGCDDIASQLVSFESNLEALYSGLDVDGLEVVLGGGRRHFLPKDASYNSPDAVSSIEGDRTDGRDLTAEWQATYADGVYVYDKTGFDTVNTETTEHLFGLFNESHMQYEADRVNDIAGEPSISDMTETALAILDNNESGYFLMVEAGRIDHSHHAGNAYGALADTIAFAKAVSKAVEMTNAEDTLIIVTADHGHVFTIAGYPKRGNPILGKVVGVGRNAHTLASDGMPYTTVGYTNGRGMRNFGDNTNPDATYNENANAGRQDLLWVDTQAPGYHQESLVPTSSETHSGEDVAIYAQGPGAPLLTGTNEQHIIFHVMNYAANLVGLAETALE